MVRFLISCSVVLTLVSVAIEQASSQTKLQLSPEQAEVWQGELNFYRYLKAKDLKGFMSLWDEKFVGWPDFSELPQHKKDIEAGVAEEFKDPAGEALPASEPLPEAVQVFGDVATTFYFWRTSASTYRITHTWRKGPQGWQIIGGMGCGVPSNTKAEAQ
jgi:ketosteroid isomerase-like protein